MAAAASDELIAATDLADLLVRRGMPFREAHGVVAGLVREARRVRAARWPSSPTPSCCGAGALADGPARQPARGWSPRSREGGTALARVREQLARGPRAARWRDAAARRPRFYDRPVLEVARDLVGCTVAHGGDGRA